MTLFEELLHGDSVVFETVGYRVHDQEWPAYPQEADAWLITGSRASVHDRDPWVLELEEWVRWIDGQGLPLVGVCFGHQLIHSALGGRTAPSPHGWNLGVYPVQAEKPWAGLDPGEALSLLAVHQDQVVDPAPGFDRLATSPQCPWYAAQRGTTLTIQGHPEFDEAFFRALMERVRLKAGDEAVDEAIAELPEHNHQEAVRHWIRQWLAGAEPEPTAG
jgi:GMP synthase-like glutamine amidotransferase